MTLQVDDLRKENQQLKKTITKVHNIAEVMGNKPDELNLDQLFENPSMDPFLIFTSRIHSSTPPKASKPEVPSESFEIPEDTININHSIHIHEIPEPTLAIIGAKEPATRTSDVLDIQKLNDTTAPGLVQPPNLLKLACLIEDRFFPVQQSQPSERPNVVLPLEHLRFCANGIVLTNMVLLVKI